MVKKSLKVLLLLLVLMTLYFLITRRISSYNESLSNILNVRFEELLKGHYDLQQVDPQLTEKPVGIKKRLQDINITGPTTVLWPDDPQCKHFVAGFSSDLPLIWLASFPRSGNTWTRYLVEAATGVYTNSIYNDKNMKNLEFNGEFEPPGTGRCILTKTHKKNPQKQELSNPTILIIRNPSRSIVSFWNYLKFRSMERMFGDVDVESYKSKGFQPFVKSRIQSWKTIIKNRLQAKKVLIAVYEEFREDPMTYISTILDFLGIQEDPARMACLAKDVTGRAKGAQREVNPYNDAHKKLFFSAIKEVESALKPYDVQLPNYILSLNTTENK